MKKKICFLTDSIFSIGGVQRVTAVIAGALSEDYDVTILTFDKPSDQDLSMYGLGNFPITYQHISYPRVGKGKEICCKAYSYLYKKVLPKCKATSDLYAYSSFPSERRDILIQALCQGQYDTIIAVHSFLAIRLATIRNRLGNTRLIGWVHNSFDALTRKGSPYLGTELKEHYGYQLQQLNGTVVLYHQDAKEYQEAYGFLPKVIYNPLTLTPGKPSNGQSKRFLAVGRFSPQHKGFDLLIQAFAIFAQRNEEWRLDIVGEGPEEEMLKKMVCDNGIGKRICLHPFTNQIQDFYSHASIYVLSSRWEGMPLVLVEAMSHGLPIVASDLPTCKEVLGDFGMFFHNGAIQELAQRLEDATHCDWLSKSQEALTIANKFNIEYIIKQWKEIIDN